MSKMSTAEHSVESEFWLKIDAKFPLSGLGDIGKSDIRKDFRLAETKVAVESEVLAARRGKEAATVLEGSSASLEVVLSRSSYNDRVERN